MFINLFNKKEKVVTRIAPSPTGVMHVGTARTAFFNYLFARQNKGKFILRIEDTDKERSKKEFEENILESMSWLGMEFDAFYRQSERDHVYEKYLKQIVDSGKAYISKETGGEREEVIRFKNPNKKITFTDLIRGEITFDTTELGDFVIAKSFKEPLYHFAVVVDDHEMDITHIIRGDDGISNTPRQILIQEAIGAKMPIYAHLPMILGTDKSKLSKRHGAVSIGEYKKQGYLNSAILNYLAMLGWNPGNEKEVFSKNELIKEFSLDKVSKSGAVFDIEKLNWFNKKHLEKSGGEFIKEEITKKIKELASFDINSQNASEIINKISPIILERISILSDIDKLIQNREIDYYFEKPDYDPRNLIWKQSNRNETIIHLDKIRDILEKQTDFSSIENIKKSIWIYADEKGRGNVLWPTRYSLSGQDKSPDPFTLIFVLGKEESLSRINIAIKKLNAMEI